MAVAVAAAVAVAVVDIVIVIPIAVAVAAVVAESIDKDGVQTHNSWHLYGALLELFEDFHAAFYLQLRQLQPRNT